MFCLVNLLEEGLRPEHKRSTQIRPVEGNECLSTRAVRWIRLLAATARRRPGDTDHDEGRFQPAYHRHDEGRFSWCCQRSPQRARGTEKNANYSVNGPKSRAPVVCQEPRVGENPTPGVAATTTHIFFLIADLLFSTCNRPCMIINRLHRELSGNSKLAVGGVDLRHVLPDGPKARSGNLARCLRGASCWGYLYYGGHTLRRGIRTAIVCLCLEVVPEARSAEGIVRLKVNIAVSGSRKRCFEIMRQPSSDHTDDTYW